MSPKIPPDMVVAAVRRAQKRKNGPVSARDILYELTGRSRLDKNYPRDTRMISAILCRTKVKDEIIRIRDNASYSKYLVKEKE